MLSLRRVRNFGWFCVVLAILVSRKWMAAIQETSGADKAPSITGYAISTGILAFLGLLCVFVPMAIQVVKESSLLAKGHLAKAIIKGIAQTPEHSGNSVYTVFRLEVHPVNEPPFETQVETLVPESMIYSYAVDDSIEVRLDPNTKAVAIVQRNEEEEEMTEEDRS